MPGPTADGLTAIEIDEMFGGGIVVVCLVHAGWLYRHYFVHGNRSGPLAWLENGRWHENWSKSPTALVAPNHTGAHVWTKLRSLPDTDAWDGR